MAELSIRCVGATADPYAAGPTLSFQMRASEATGVRVHAVALRAQLRIEPQKRRYSAAETARLGDLFGEPSRWADTLRPLQFATVSAMVPGFRGTCEFELPVPCTYDLEIAATSYFHALGDGAIPLLMLFSGTVLSRGAADGTGLAVEPVSWRAEAHHQLPVAVWREMMDRFFPNSGWLRLSRESLHALGAYKTARALPTWEQVVTALLDEAACRETP